MLLQNIKLSINLIDLIMARWVTDTGIYPCDPSLSVDPFDSWPMTHWHIVSSARDNELIADNNLANADPAVYALISNK